MTAKRKTRGRLELWAEVAIRIGELTLALQELWKIVVTSELRCIRGSEPPTVESLARTWARVDDTRLALAATFDALEKALARLDAFDALDNQER